MPLPLKSLAIRTCRSWKIGMSYTTPQSHLTRALSSKSTIIKRMPEGSWDSHMHVTSPDYPLATNAAYKPSLHSLDHAMKFENTIGIKNIVLVQPSIYGNDNSCLLDSLKEIGPDHGRGVVAFDPDTIEPDTLQHWHSLGVRGVRLNLKSNNEKFTKASLEKMLHQYANVVRPLNWVIELFIGMDDIPLLVDIIPALKVKVCIAHFGAPQIDGRNHPVNCPGFDAVIDLVQDGNVWVKFSGAYRFAPDGKMRGIEGFAKELLIWGGSRVVFASDWPHTRFEGLDVKPFVKKCLDWSDEHGLTEALFRDNAKELWDVA